VDSTNARFDLSTHDILFRPIYFAFFFFTGAVDGLCIWLVPGETDYFPVDTEAFLGRLRVSVSTMSSRFPSLCMHIYIRVARAHPMPWSPAWAIGWLPTKWCRVETLDGPQVTSSEQHGYCRPITSPPSQTGRRQTPESGAPTAGRWFVLELTSEQN
jgi:hypothetical protein